MDIQLDRERILQTFLSLACIDNPSLDERAMADEVQKHLIELGTAFLEDDSYTKTGGTAGNIYALFLGEKDLPPLLFSAHLDSVEPASGKHPMILPDGRITSDGTTVLGADDIAGVTAILEALYYINTQKLPHRHIELVFTCAEELYDLGSEHLNYRRLKSRDVYVLDATGAIGTFIFQSPTILSFEIQVCGRSAHAGFHPEDGIHAIKIAAEAIAAARIGRIDESVTVNIGEISGGSGINTIPDRCTVRGEIRSYIHERCLEEMENITKLFRAAAENHGGAIHISQREGCRAYAIDQDAPVIRRFQKVCREQSLPFLPVRSFGGSDNNNFVKQGKSGIVLSCGMEYPHSLQEAITVEHLVALTRAVIALMVSDE